MENFAEVKENILSQVINNKNIKENVQNCESWEQLKEIIIYNIFWFKKNNIVIPDGHYKSSKHEFTIVNGKLHGEYKRRFESSGRLAEQVLFKEGKLDSEYKSWYGNGQLKNISFYKEDTLHGELIKWYPDGKVEIRSFYKDGELIYNEKLNNNNMKVSFQYNQETQTVDLQFKGLTTSEFDALRIYLTSITPELSNLSQEISKELKGDKFIRNIIQNTNETTS
jgi:antitoxin component YwqK of YwqJK toxin-antitoxin module